jgi:hypothetical protein
MASIPQSNSRVLWSSDWTSNKNMMKLWKKLLSIIRWRLRPFSCRMEPRCQMKWHNKWCSWLCRRKA